MSLINSLESFRDSMELNLLVNSLKGKEKTPIMSSETTGNDDLYKGFFAHNSFPQHSAVAADKQTLKSDSVSQSDILNIVKTKGATIVALVKSTGLSFINEDEMRSLDENKRSEVKFFSTVMLILKIMNETGTIDKIIDFIRDASSKKVKTGGDVNLSGTEKHRLMESALLHVMESEVIPSLDSKIPGGVGTISLIMQHLK